MKLSPLALVVASLAFSTFAVTGCAADTDPADSAEDAEDVGVSESELSSFGKTLVGKYEWRAGDSGGFVDFESLELKANGTYAAKAESDKIVCVRFPCTLPESGTWSTFRSGGKWKLRVRPQGAPTRSYFASKSNDQLTLSRLGATTVLFQLGANTCANVRCAAGTHCEMKGINGGAIPVCIQDAPLAPCVRTGCSGHVCADQHRYTTCEFRPEYACYQQATCERQADGACGFTQTPALSACLAGN
jgi:hypothetical protein